MIYLDSNATTRSNRQMVASVCNDEEHIWANPSSQHHAGQIAKEALSVNRKAVADLLGAKPEEIIFTSGGTEANNIALANDMLRVGSSVEHSSVDKNLDYRIPVDAQGFLDIGRLEEYLEDTTLSMVSVMLANNETGVILDPLCRIIELREKYSFIYHIDAVQAIGKAGIDCNISRLGADMMTISGHKFHAPKGVGALYMRPGVLDQIRHNNNAPPVFVGGSQEYGIRPGTENITGIAGMAYMCEKIRTDEHYKERIGAVKKHRDLFESLLADISVVNGSIEHRVSNTSNLSFPDVVYLDLFLDELSIAGVCASAGSACSSGLPEPSRVLVSMFGENSSRLNNSVRFSFSVDHTLNEVEEAAAIVRSVVGKLKTLLD